MLNFHMDMILFFSVLLIQIHPFTQCVRTYIKAQYFPNSTQMQSRLRSTRVFVYMHISYIFINGSTTALCKFKERQQKVMPWGVFVSEKKPISNYNLLVLWSKRNYRLQRSTKDSCRSGRRTTGKKAMIYTHNKTLYTTIICI